MTSKEIKIKGISKLSSEMQEFIKKQFKTLGCLTYMRFRRTDDGFKLISYSQTNYSENMYLSKDNII